MLPKTYRLSKDKEYQAVFKKGRSLFSPLINIRFCKNELSFSRFGIIVSNKVSKRAVKRNRIKRQLRAILLAHLKEIQPFFDCIIIAKPTIIGKDYHEIEVVLLGLLKKARII